MELISYLGSLCLAFCGLPEVIRSIKNKKCDIGWGMILMWQLGEIMLLIYVIDRKEHALMINYLVNSILVSVLFYYKVRGSLNKP